MFVMRSHKFYSHSKVHKAFKIKQCPRSSTYRKDRTVGFATLGGIALFCLLIFYGPMRSQVKNESRLNNSTSISTTSSRNEQRENQIECLIENLADVTYSDLGQVMVNVNTAICSYVKQHPYSSHEMLSALNDISLMCMAVTASREFINNECKRIETEVQL